jgi:indolepyruvate ferredoxin oxidoreductase
MTAFKWMARFKGLRGSWLDPFRSNAERRLDQALLAEYEADITQLLASLNTATLPAAVELASLPASIRGYGPVKQAQAAAAAARRDALRLQAAGV